MILAVVKLSELPRSQPCDGEELTLFKILSRDALNTVWSTLGVLTLKTTPNTSLLATGEVRLLQRRCENENVPLTTRFRGCRSGFQIQSWQSWGGEYFYFFCHLQRGGRVKVKIQCLLLFYVKYWIGDLCVKTKILFTAHILKPIQEP